MHKKIRKTEKEASPRKTKPDANRNGSNHWMDVTPTGIRETHTYAALVYSGYREGQQQRPKVHVLGERIVDACVPQNRRSRCDDVQMRSCFDPRTAMPGTGHHWVRQEGRNRSHP